MLGYYQQANEAFPEDKALSLSAHNNTGNALKELGRYAAAEEEFQEALSVAANMDSPLLEARILTNIASAQYLAGNLDEAERTIQRGFNIAYKSAPEWLPFLFGVRAQIVFARGNAAMAGSYLERTFEGQDLGSTASYYRDFHETAYKAYSQTGGL